MKSRVGNRERANQLAEYVNGVESFFPLPILPFLEEGEPISNEEVDEIEAHFKTAPIDKLDNSELISGHVAEWVRLNRVVPKKARSWTELRHTFQFALDKLTTLGLIIYRLNELLPVFSMVVNAILALASSVTGLLNMAIMAVEDAYLVLTNKEIKQRKTRLATDAITLANVGVALVIVLGVLAAPFYVVPLIFLTIMFSHIVKDHYIKKQTQLLLTNKKAERADLQTELTQTLNQLKRTPDFRKREDEIECLEQDISNLRASMKNEFEPKQLAEINKQIQEKQAVLQQHKIRYTEALLNQPSVKRITEKLLPLQQEIASLNIQATAASKKRDAMAVGAVGVVVLLLGTILFPPAAIVGLFVVIGSGFLHKKASQTEARKLAELSQAKGNSEVELLKQTMDTQFGVQSSPAPTESASQKPAVKTHDVVTAQRSLQGSGTTRYGVMFRPAKAKGTESPLPGLAEPLLSANKIRV